MKKHARGRSTKATKTSKRSTQPRFILPGPCHGGCGKTASGDFGPLAYCDLCWYAKRAAELIRLVPPNVAEEICAELQRRSA